MRDIEGIEKVVEKLAPHWADIVTHFHSQNKKLISLLERDHDLIGRVLKSHLIVEHYVTMFLITQYQLEKLKDANLSFFQKAMLLPDKSSTAAFVKPGILNMNTVRNKFGHQIDATLEDSDIPAINSILSIARQGVDFPSPIDKIEAFTTVACTFLVVPPPFLQDVFMEAFSDIRLNRL